MPHRESAPHAPAPDFKQSILEYLVWAEEIDGEHSRSIATARWDALDPEVRRGLELEAAQAFPNNPIGKGLYLRATMLDGYISDETALVTELEATFAADSANRDGYDGGEAGPLAA